MSDIQPLKEDVVHAGTIEDPIPQKLIFVQRDSTGAKKVYTLGMGGTTGGSEVSVNPATDIVTGIVKLTDDMNVNAPAATGSVAMTPNGVKASIEAAKSEVSTTIDSKVDQALQDAIQDGSLNDAITGAVEDVVQDKIDSGEITGGDTMNYVVTPTITTPTANQTGVSTLPTVAASPYKNVFEDDARNYRVFQIANNTSFSPLLVDQQVNADNFSVTTQLTPNTILYVRVKDVSTGGYESKWSSVVKFTTAQGVIANTPVVTLHGYADSPTDILSGLTITTNAYSVAGGTLDTHKATSWSISTKEGTRGVVWQSLKDTTNKTSITVPEGTLAKATAYTLSVTFHGTTSFDSAPAVVDFTTSADFGTVNAPTLTVQGGPNQVFETPSLTGGAFSNTRDPDTHDKTDWEILDASGASSVWQSLNNVSDKTTITVPKGSLQVATAYKARVRYHGAKYGWSAYTVVDFSTVAAFNSVNQPTITVAGAPDNIKETPVLTASAFGGVNVTHKSTDWQILKASDNSTVWEKLGDTSNLLSITVPKGKLKVSTGYIFRVRFNANEGVTSEWGQATYTTVANFIRYNYIGVPGTSTFGVGLATQEQYESVQLTPAPNCENESDFQYALYVRGEDEDRNSDSVAMKFIPPFYLAMLQKEEGTVNLSDSELDALLPYVEVTKGQMKEAQRRSPHNAMVVAPFDKFTTESEANQHGFYLMRGFVDGGETKLGFFIANTLSWTHVSKDTSEYAFFVTLKTGRASLSNLDNTLYGDGYAGLYRADTENGSDQEGDGSTSGIFDFNGDGTGAQRGPNNAKNNFIARLEGTPYQCCSVFAWAIISVLSLIQGQYATSASQCAWYDATLVKNYPKGINYINRDTNDTTVTSDTIDEAHGNIFVTQGYEKTTHNGSITGITNVNGWLWQCVIGSWGNGSKLLKRNASIYDITYNNVDNSNALFWSTRSIGSISQDWGGVKSSFPNLAGVDRDFFGIYPFGNNNTTNSNEFGLDYYDQYLGGQMVIVGGDYDDTTSAGEFCRSDCSSAISDSGYGFRAMAYPNPAIGGTGNDTVPPSGGGGS